MFLTYQFIDSTCTGQSSVKDHPPQGPYIRFYKHTGHCAAYFKCPRNDISPMYDKLINEKKNHKQTDQWLNKLRIGAINTPRIIDKTDHICH